MTKELKEIGKAAVEGLTVFVGFGMLTILLIRGQQPVALSSEQRLRLERK